MDQWQEIGTGTDVYYTTRDMYHTVLVCVSNRQKSTAPSDGPSSTVCVEFDFSLSENVVLLQRPTELGLSTSFVSKCEVAPGSTLVAAVLQPLHPATRMPTRVRFDVRLVVPSLIDRTYPALTYAKELSKEVVGVTDEFLAEAERQSDAIDAWLSGRKQRRSVDQ